MLTGLAENPGDHDLLADGWRQGGKGLDLPRQHFLAFLPLPHGHFSLRPGSFSFR